MVGTCVRVSKEVSVCVYFSFLSSRWLVIENFDFMRMETQDSLETEAARGKDR